MSDVRAALVYLLCIIAAAGHSAAQDVDPTPDAKKANARPAAKVAASSEPFDNVDVKTLASNCVRLETEAGAIEIELFPESAPETVRNFLNLVASGMYDTTTFHRIVPDFVIQGGSLATRSGPLTAAIMARSERRLADEPNKIFHDRGIVSMARTDEANSATTSFFILMRREVRLDGTFSAFGRVTKGMNVADAINRAPSMNEKPAKAVRIRSASLFACSPPTN